MQILQTIQAHVAAMRLPLYAVTLSAVAQPDTPLMLILHWHGFHREAPMRLPGVDIPLRSVAGSALQLDAPWREVEALDDAMLDAAWKLGAWDLERVTHRPWWRLSAPLEETVNCQRAFACYPSEANDRHVVANAKDQAELVELAAMRGYVRWLFRPRACGIWKEVDEDDITLEADNRRSSPCPVKPAAFDRHRPGKRLYRLGRAGTFILSGGRGFQLRPASD